MSASRQWAEGTQHVEAGEWLTVDGKSIKGSVQAPGSSYQNFVNVVSGYSHQRGVVVALQQFENDDESLHQGGGTLLASLKPTNVVFIFDALHCKKTLRRIVEQGNDYLVRVKGN